MATAATLARAVAMLARAATLAGAAAMMATAVTTAREAAMPAAGAMAEGARVAAGGPWRRRWRRRRRWRQGPVDDSHLQRGRRHA